MKRRRQIYEGKAKILYEGPEPGTLIQYFKDDTTAFDATKKATLDGKGVLNNRISEYLMTQLNAIGVPTHFVRRINMREQLVKEVEIIPLGSWCATSRQVRCPSASASRKAPRCRARSSSTITRTMRSTIPG
jgi:phosphoribosylaminoimidazole-succinocarboxamide synthase